MIKISEIKALQTNNPDALIVILSSEGNPDFRQYAPVSPAKIEVCQTLAEAQKFCRDYIEEWDLGGGNWSGGQVYTPKGQIATISYNGRVWYPSEDWKKQKEYPAELLNIPAKEL